MWRNAVPVASMCATLGRSGRAVCDRMAALQLATIPPGWVSMPAGAALVGVNVRTFVRLVARRRLTTRESYARRPGRAGVAIVRRADAVEAAAGECRGVETINHGARARGLRPTTLGAWLAALGAHRPQPGRRSPVRFPSALLDTAAAWGASRGGRSWRGRPGVS